MPVATDPDECEDDTESELTPEQRENLRKSMENLGRAIVPIDPKFQNLVTPAFNALAADMVKLPLFKLPESTIANLSAMTGIGEAAQTARLAMMGTIQPVLDAQAQWAKHLGVINSDVFKSAALAQSNLNSIAAQITTNVDFGLSGTFASLAQQFAAQQSSWLKDLGPTLEKLKASFYPPNLRPIAGLRLEEVEQVVMVDGIALYNVPRAAIAEALVRADGASKRREILGRKWKPIVADCRSAVNGCKTETVAPYVTIAVAALNALEAGHVEAAQALIGSLVDALVNTYFGKNRHLYTPDKRGNRTNAAYDEFGAHEYIAFAPVWQAWQKFFPDEGQPVPSTFSRNATAHTVSAKQFTRRNAIQGLMIVCGILVFLDEQAAIIEGRSAA
jgi:hypothetical protein